MTREREAIVQRLQDQIQQFNRMVRSHGLNKQGLSFRIEPSVQNVFARSTTISARIVWTANLDEIFSENADVVTFQFVNGPENLGFTADKFRATRDLIESLNVTLREWYNAHNGNDSGSLVVEDSVDEHIPNRRLIAKMVDVKPIVM
jgi:hypothetical protein